MSAVVLCHEPAVEKAAAGIFSVALLHRSTIRENQKQRFSFERKVLTKT